jgi:hypothetical protein
MKSNEARFEWHAQNAGELELEQRITVESGLSRVRAEYDFASGRTRIEEVHGETRTRTDDVGLVLVQLVTRNGALVVEY